jgi:hypothetical protein
MNRAVKIIFNVICVLVVLMGITWVLQGIGVMPGSSMTGQRQWAVNGAVAVVVGLVLLWLFNRRPARL